MKTPVLTGNQSQNFLVKKSAVPLYKQVITIIPDLTEPGFNGLLSTSKFSCSQEFKKDMMVVLSEIMEIWLTQKQKKFPAVMEKISRYTQKKFENSAESFKPKKLCHTFALIIVYKKIFNFTFLTSVINSKLADNIFLPQLINGNS